MHRILGRIGELFDRPTRIQLIAGTLGTVVIALLDTVAITLVLPIVDLAVGKGDSQSSRWISSALGNPDHDTLIFTLVIVLVLLFVIKDVLSMAFMWWLTGLITNERAKLAAELLRRYLHTPYTEVSQRSSADMLRVMNDAVFQVFSSVVPGVMISISGISTILAVFIALLIMAPLQTVVIAGYFLVASLGYSRLVKPTASRAGKEMTQAALESFDTALTALGGIKEINLRGSQDFFHAEYRRAALRTGHSARIQGFLGSLPRYALEILFILAVAVLLITASGSSQADALGLIALFVAAGFRVLPAISGLLSSLSGIGVGAASLELVVQEMRTDKGAVTSSTPHTVSDVAFRREMQVRDVSFNYPGADQPALRSVSLVVPWGTSTAFVGPSGAGKTTLVDLMIGLHAPSSGAILIDGVDIAESRTSWSRDIGYVPQEVFIRDASLAENIAFDQAAGGIDRNRLTEAISRSQLSSLVETLPDGVETRLGERGARLSGGQRQRVGIARALYRRPSLLVLDEATSALDNDTERRIADVLGNLQRTMTIIVVAHRLSTVRHCDQIVFVTDGSIRAQGTFRELLDGDPEFARLVRLGSLDLT